MFVRSARHSAGLLKTLADVVAAAKAKPGTLSYATVGAGSIGHLAKTKGLAA